MPKILAVDDEQEIFNIIENFLVKNGYEVIGTTDGEEAREWVRRGEKFDLAILDIKMPKVSGVDLLKEMAATGCVAPVLILSGSIGFQENVDELRQLGYDEEEILYKPIDLYDLLNKVKEKLKPKE